MKKYLIAAGEFQCLCSGCFPRRGSKARKIEFRKAKRKESRKAMKFEKMNNDEL